MKKLKKMKLINWHTFYSDTIEIKDNCLITGVNGSGKSTLLDAIQYVLTAGKVKFNQAADDTSKRTVETYIRGKVGYDSKEFLRDEVTSYIVLEFYDDDKKQSDLLGTVIEFSPLMNKPNRLFFKLIKSEIEDDLFIKENCAKALSEFKKIPGLESTDSSKEFQKIICSFLGIAGKNRYFELLAKSLAFKPINDVNDFVNNFLLTDSSISLDALQQNIENFSRLEREIELEEKKIGKLEEIEMLHQEYEKVIDNINKNVSFLEFIKKDKLEHEIKFAQEQRTKCQIELNLKTDEVVKHEKEKENVNKTIRDYEISLKENNEYQLYDKWETELKSLKQEQEKLIPRVKSFNRLLKDETNLLKNFDWSQSLQKMISPLEDMNTFEKIFIDSIDKKNECKEKYEKEKMKLGVYKEEKEIIKRDLEDKISLLERKQFPYKETVRHLIVAIKEHFEEKKHEKIEVRPLCEYIEVTDEKWRNALEGYLNNQRFDLIVEPKYFDEALLVYERYKKERNIYGVGLVNTQKLEKATPDFNTLASFIKVFNPNAERYALFLLNKVTCCEDIKDLKNHKNAITPSCMTYRNHVARQINPNVYSNLFLGQKGLELQLIKYKEELSDVNQEYNELLEKYNKVMDDLRCLKNSKLESLQAGIYDLKKCEEIKDAILSCEKNRNGLEIDGLLNNVLSKKKEAEEKQTSLQEKVNALNKEIATEEIKIDQLNLDIKNREEELKSFVHVSMSQEWEEEYTVLKSKYNLFELESKIERVKKEHENQLNKIGVSIEYLQKEYHQLYQFDEIVGIEHVSSYLNELHKKREIDLVRRKSQSVEFKEACQISFREDFISKLKDKIECAKQDIKELNKSLKDKKFGTERYEFVFDESKDSEMATYYRIITSGDNYQMNTLFESHLSEADRQALDDLFSKISISASEDMTKRILDKYTDYRNYMSYDIKVTKDNGEFYSFSKLAKEKSGGEIQTPFYVIIAASFEQLLNASRRNSSIGCVVMFDEAFNNMDESRIEAMMHFYKDLNVQLLIAVPPEKTYIISPYVETTLMVLNNENGTYVKNVRLGDIEYGEAV